MFHERTGALDGPEQFDIHVMASFPEFIDNCHAERRRVAGLGMDEDPYFHKGLFSGQIGNGIGRDALGRF